MTSGDELPTAVLVRRLPSAIVSFSQDHEVFGDQYTP
jgi:hypothetical protein